MDTIRFAYISLECARIRPHRHASSVDIWLVHRQSIKFKANSLFSFKSIVIVVVEMYVLTINSLTSEIITIVLILCSEIIRQKSPIVSSSGSCVMMNDSELS